MIGTHSPVDWMYATAMPRMGMLAMDEHRIQTSSIGCQAVPSSAKQNVVVSRTAWRAFTLGGGGGGR